MTNWKNIHPDFTPELQKDWEKNGITYSEIHGWIQAGFKPENHHWVKKWKSQNFNHQQVAELINFGLEPKSYEFAIYLKWKGYNFQQISNLEKLKKEFTVAQNYLDCFYPLKERKMKKKIEIKNKNLEGDLDLSDFVNLEYLNCSDNQLTALNLGNCLNLENLQLTNNQLTQLNLTNCSRLKVVWCSNNNFSEQSLSMFKELINLEILKVGNISRKRINQYNRFNGSLKFLQKLTKLKELDISNTDLDKGVEYLPASLRNQKGRKKLFYSTEFRPESKLKEITGQLTNFLEYGLCKKCQKPNVGHNWCQLCDSNTNNQDVHEFIQLQNKSFNHKERLEWVPYEKFADISKEPIGEGGFGKVYKARWRERKGKKKIVLKVLHNSQNITKKFLREIANHKLLSSDRIVKCHGVSQDPTGNQIMVINYIKDGNLRQFLRNNQLNFKDKLNQLWRIADGLKEIHEKGLIHRDFHPGNILNRKDVKANEFKYDVKCIITDLGLCQPASEKDENKIYGILPYIDPEVLKNKRYTQTSDIYSFGMVAYELFSSRFPHCEYNHDRYLAEKIMKGLRPNLDNVKIPYLLKELISHCWDADPEKRPTIGDLIKSLNDWRKEISNKKSAEFVQQYQEIEKAEKITLCQVISQLYREYKKQIKTVELDELEKIRQELFSEFCQQYRYKENTKSAREEFDKLLTSKFPCQDYSPRLYTSRLLDFQNLPRPQNNPSQEWQNSTLLELKIKAIEEEINLLKKPLENELAELVDKLIEIKKESIKNEELKSNVWELEDKLEEKGLSREKLDEIIRCCENLVELEQKWRESQGKTQANIEISTNK
ncbi:MAG: protein kinase [Candidatus Moeniiplasma glomeromycotorum]|nr:protein kinase [Candidatus Moeniiplasma glomeromycotorum]MCE8167260.1 protein kinase [Candidatus Moeniiplasma glomeromycotorum]MCE8168727.1 protein kinase [Candidatus Moeniiplasma glomeromycotorum]